LTDEPLRLAKWYFDDELDLCSACGEKRVTPAFASPTGSRVCLACGAVWTGPITGAPDRWLDLDNSV
jgi:hypothetical protein